MMNTPTAVYVAEREVPVERVAVRNMNFGQGSEGHPVHRYSLVVPTREVVRAMEAYYREFALDDTEHGEEDDPESVLRLRGLHWPALDQVADDDPPLFAEFTRRFLAFEFLNTLFRSADYTPVRYLINSVDHVEQRGDDLALTGQVIEVSGPPRP